MAASNGFSMNLPVLDGKNYARWSNQMTTIFGFQGVLDVIQSGYTAPAENASEAQIAEAKERKKDDYKALFLIHQCLNDANYEKICNATTAKEAWETLAKIYEGVNKVKKV